MGGPKVLFYKTRPPFFEEEDIFRAQKKGREHTLVLGRM